MHKKALSSTQRSREQNGGQWSLFEVSGINPHIYGYLILITYHKYTLVKDNISTNGTGQTTKVHVEKYK